MIDGEVVVIDENGHCSYNALQYSRPEGHIQLYAFDILVHRGRNVLRLPIEKRRTLYSLTPDEMQNCQWLYPQLVAQIDFAEWTPDGHLRHASFAGLRTDKEPRSIY